MAANHTNIEIRIARVINSGRKDPGVPAIAAR